MEQEIVEELQRLARTRIGQLRARYRDVYAEKSTSGHRQHLVRRIGWRLQVLAQGDLSERAARRALELANDADLRVQVPATWYPRSRRRRVRCGETGGCQLPVVCCAARTAAAT
jgi:hypothetical protein